MTFIIPALILLFLMIILAFVMALNAETTVPLPVYEQQLGNIRFVFVSARDLGNTLKASEAVSTSYGSQKDLTTKEKFIEVTIGAQNKGTVNTEQGAWDIGNVIDLDGRNFVPLDGYVVNPWLPAQNSCGVLLKPAFDPAPCAKIYEVAKGSGGFKIEIMTGINNNSANDFAAGRRQKYLLDLIVK